MNILYIATSFPTPEQGSTIYTDLAEALHENGHKVVVVVSEQIKKLKKSQIKTERGIDVIRIVVGNYYDVGFLEKGISVLLLPYLIKYNLPKFLKVEKFDLILYESPPVTNGGLVRWAKKKFNAKTFLMLKDIFPQNAIDLGIIKENSLVHKYFKSKEKQLYVSSDIIGCMSVANINYLLSHNKWLSEDKVVIFPNTKKIENIKPLNKDYMRDQYNIPSDATVFMFGGNMGKPQNIDLLVKIIDHFKADTNKFFMFVGRGTEKQLLTDIIKSSQIKNAIVLDNLPREQYDEIIEICDLGLIVLDPRFTIPNYPSRILSYMEHSKAVLAITDNVSDIKDLIKEADCGDWVWSGDFREVIEKVELLSSLSNLSEKGLNGRNYFVKNLCVSNSVMLIESESKKRGIYV